MLRKLHWFVLWGVAGLGCSGDIQGLTDGDESDQFITTAEPPGLTDDDSVAPDDTSDVAYATVGQRARVTASSGLHLRTGPSTNYAIILTMPYNATVNVVAGSGGWYKVTYSGHTGWASGAYLATIASGGGSSSTPVDRAISRARSGVGFSYHWGGGCWDPGSGHPGACYGNCPNCSHSGTWGADCSGYVAKIWQVPGASALTSCTHPYSTYNFRYTRAHWNPVARSNARRGDALVHHESGSGHIFLFESGDGWGWIRAYEAKGCSYGIQHDTRMAASNYIAIRRNGY